MCVYIITLYYTRSVKEKKKKMSIKTAMCGLIRLVYDTFTILINVIRQYCVMFDENARVPR